MSRQRQHMLQSLVQRARAVGNNLRIEVPSFAAAGSDDEAAYTFFFEEFLGKLVGVAKDFDKRVVEESRDLLVVATTRIFCNLKRLDASIDLAAVTGPVEPSFRTKAMQEAAEAYAKKFEQAVIFEGDGGSEEDAEEEEGRTAGGASTSGGAQA